MGWLGNVDWSTLVGVFVGFGLGLGGDVFKDFMADWRSRKRVMRFLTVEINENIGKLESYQEELLRNSWYGDSGDISASAIVETRLPQFLFEAYHSQVGAFGTVRIAEDKIAAVLRFYHDVIRLQDIYELVLSRYAELEAREKWVEQDDHAYIDPETDADLRINQLMKTEERTFGRVLARLIKSGNPLS